MTNADCKDYGTKRILPSSEMLRSVGWFSTDVSGLRVGPDLKMGPIRSPETSVLNQPTLHNIPEDGRIQVNHSGSQWSRNAEHVSPNLLLSITPVLQEQFLNRYEVFWGRSSSWTSNKAEFVLGQYIETVFVQRLLETTLVTIPTDILWRVSRNKQGNRQTRCFRNDWRVDTLLHGDIFVSWCVDKLATSVSGAKWSDRNDSVDQFYLKLLKQLASLLLDVATPSRRRD
jgi:hypothetical protein